MRGGEERRGRKEGEGGRAGVGRELGEQGGDRREEPGGRSQEGDRVAGRRQ